MEDLTGKQLGPYQILSPLGEGGMAAVYKAYQPRMERYVAMKILPRHFASDPEFVSRFSQEARVIANLQHPHILPVHDFGEADGYTYLVMRFVEGGSLTGWLKERQPIPLQKVVSVITQVGGALDYAHSQGVIHRDIKPGNVLVDKWDNCLLTDFGLAKIVESSAHLTQTGGILGTPAYMSPEQGLGRKIDHRSDIYSLGVVLYQMAVGYLPYEAETPMAVVIKHIHDPLPPPRQRNPSIPEGVELVILRALAKKPADRFDTAGDMVKALIHATAGTAAAYVAPPTPPSPLAEPAPVEPGAVREATRVTPGPPEQIDATELLFEESAVTGPPDMAESASEVEPMQVSYGPVEELAPTELFVEELAPTELMSEGPSQAEHVAEAPTPAPRSTRPGAPGTAVAVPRAKSKLPVILAGVAGVIVVGLITLVLSGAFSSGDEEEVPGVAEATRPLAPTTAAGGAIQPPAAGEGDTELPPLEPDSPAMEELMAQVNQAYMEDDLHRALVLLDEGIARAPVFAELFCQRGNVLRDLEALGEAAASFEHCLALAEEQGLSELRIDARGLLAITQTRQAMLEQEDPDLALAVMNEALADPYSPTWLYCERAELLVEFGDRSAAIEDYEACRAGDQGDQYWLTRLYEVKGGLSLDEEDYGAAADLFTAWSELEPHTPWPFCYLGEALTGLAEFGQAIGAFERCRELSTEDEDAAQWASTGIFAAQAYEAESAEEWLAALEAFDQAIGISSDEAWLHCERGRILMQLDALDEARHSLQACLEMSGDDAQARESAETLLQELGDRLP